MIESHFPNSRSRLVSRIRVIGKRRLSSLIATALIHSSLLILQSSYLVLRASGPLGSQACVIDCDDRPSLFKSGCLTKLCNY